MRLPTLMAITLLAGMQAQAAGPISVAGDGGPFEGKWEHCETWQGYAVCSDYTLLQRGRNVCGTWSYFATNAGYQGQLQLTAIRRLTARKDLICGDSGSETRQPCTSEYVPDGGWEPKQGYLIICKGVLQDADQSSVKHCHSNLRRHRMDEADRLALLARGWMQQCLARP